MIKKLFILTITAFFSVNVVFAADLKQLAEQLVNLTVKEPKAEVLKHLELLDAQGIKDEETLKNLTISYFASKEANKKGMNQYDFRKEIGSKIGYFLKRGWNEQEVMAQYIKYRQLGYSQADAVAKTEKILKEMKNPDGCKGMACKDGKVDWSDYGTGPTLPNPTNIIDPKNIGTTGPTLPNPTNTIDPREMVKPSPTIPENKRNGGKKDMEKYRISLEKAGNCDLLFEYRDGTSTCLKDKKYPIYSITKKVLEQGKNERKQWVGKKTVPLNKEKCFDMGGIFIISSEGGVCMGPGDGGKPLPFPINPTGPYNPSPAPVFMGIDPPPFCYRPLPGNGFNTPPLQPIPVCEEEFVLRIMGGGNNENNGEKKKTLDAFQDAITKAIAIKKEMAPKEIAEVVKENIVAVKNKNWIKIREKAELKVSDNEKIEIKEIKREGNKTKVKGVEKAYLFGFIGMNIDVEAEINDDGKVKNIDKPWYLFLLW